MNIENEFKEWLSLQPIKKVNKSATETLFKRFTAYLINTPEKFCCIANIIWEVERGQN